MGHSLERVIQPVLDKYNRDIDEAHHEGFEEGAEYIEDLLLDWADTHSEHETFIRQLVAWTKTRPSR